MRKRLNINKGTSNTNISNILGINMSTLGYWKNAKDFRNRIFQLLKCFSVLNLEKIRDLKDLYKNGRAFYLLNNETSYIEFKIGDIINADNRFLNLLMKENCCITIKEFINTEFNNIHSQIILPQKYDLSSFIIIKHFTIITTTESIL